MTVERPPFFALARALGFVSPAATTPVPSPSTRRFHWRSAATLCSRQRPNLVRHDPAGFLFDHGGQGDTVEGIEPHIGDGGVRRERAGGVPPHGGVDAEDCCDEVACH